MTPPFGHSTAGSYRRDKSSERLKFEADYDPVARMRAWLVDAQVAGEDELRQFAAATREEVDAHCVRT